MGWGAGVSKKSVQLGGLALAEPSLSDVQLRFCLAVNQLRAELTHRTHQLADDIGDPATREQSRIRFAALSGESHALTHVMHTLPWLATTLQTERGD